MCNYLLARDLLDRALQRPHSGDRSSKADNVSLDPNQHGNAQDYLKAIGALAAEQEFSKREIEAMKQVAKLRVKDQKGAAQEKLEALERIGKAVGMDLFDFAGVRE